MRRELNEEDQHSVPLYRPRLKRKTDLEGTRPSYGGNRPHIMGELGPRLQARCGEQEGYEFDWVQVGEKLASLG